MIIDRELVKNLLLRWSHNQVDSRHVIDWVQENYLQERIDELDWEDDESVINEILSVLENLNINLIIKDDIDEFINFLSTPIGKFHDGYSKWISYLNSIDYPKRKNLLKCDKFYSNYC